MIEPLTPQEIEAWRDDLARVVQPERHSLRALATIDKLNEELTEAREWLSGKRWTLGSPGDGGEL